MNTLHQPLNPGQYFSAKEKIVDIFIELALWIFSYTTNFVSNYLILNTAALEMGKWEQLTLPELYDLLAEETVRFNKQLLQKTAREEFKDLKEMIKKIQEEIKRRTATPSS